MSDTERLRWLVERAISHVNLDNETRNILADDQLWPKLAEELPEKLGIMLGSEITGMIGIFVPGGGLQLNCDLPHNKQKVWVNASVTCTNQSCKKIYCLKHNMDNCPNCGTKL